MNVSINNNWKEILDIAQDGNVLCYDADACTGEFTKRLVSLMQTIIIRNSYKCKITHLYIPYNSLLSSQFDNIEECDKHLLTVVKLFGIELMLMYGLEKDGSFIHYFKNDLDCSLAAADENLVVGIDQSYDQNSDFLDTSILQQVRLNPRRVILGSY